jgi:hypothetical protein
LHVTSPSPLELSRSVAATPDALRPGEGVGKVLQKRDGFRARPRRTPSIPLATGPYKLERVVLQDYLEGAEPRTASRPRPGAGNRWGD